MIAPRSIAKSHTIPTLDGWRALAVSLVIGAHCFGRLLQSPSGGARLLGRVLGHTGFGVDIFFALSGFLICTLLLREKERTGSISLSRFYLRRVFRILPPMLTYLAVVVLLSRLRILPHVSRNDIFEVLFFVRNYFIGSWYTGHFWSLAVEEHFYAVVPVFLLLLSWRRALNASIFLAGVCILTRWCEFHAYPNGGFLEFRTENRFDVILWGAVLALLLHRAGWRASIQRHFSTVAFCIFTAALLLALNGIPSKAGRRTLVACGLPALIGYTVTHPGSLFGRFLDLPFLRWMGRLSYSLYIWQEMFLVEGPQPLGVLQTLPLALVCTLLCACLSYYFIEKPMINLGHRVAGAPGHPHSPK